MFLLALLGVLPPQDPARAREPGHAVEFRRLPEGELQPQLMTDPEGLLHLLSFRGDPAAGELLMRRFGAREEHWSEPVVVGSGAVAAGTGAQLALGPEGREHVVWVGAALAQPRASPSARSIRSARSSDDGRTFGPACDIAVVPPGSDPGPGIAGDARGRVWIAWHAPEGRDADGEQRPWIARSSDGGSTFGAARLVHPLAPGACADCRVALACTGEQVYMVYRSARAGNQRGMVLAFSRDGGERFEFRTLDDWQTERCPRSSASLLVTPRGVLAAWERAGSISRAWFDGLESRRESRVTRMVSGTDGWGPVQRRAELKHPALALGADGALLTVSLADVLWGTEAKLDWQLEDGAGEFLAKAPRPIQPVPSWDLAAAFARPDGSFVIVY